MTWLAAVIALLASAAASYGLASWTAGGSPETFTIRDERVLLFGRGLYRYDALLIGAGFIGVDVVTLAVAIPLLIISVVLYRRGSVRGGLLLTGTMAYFLYNYASMAFGAAYNEAFPAYVAIFSASLFALIAAFASFDLDRLMLHVSTRVPRWIIAVYLVAVATFLLLIRRSALGLLLASTMLTVMFTIGIALIAQSAAIVLAGVQLTQGEMIGLVISFGVLCVTGILLATVLLRCVSDEPLPAAERQAA